MRVQTEGVSPIHSAKKTHTVTSTLNGVTIQRSKHSQFASSSKNRQERSVCIESTTSEQGHEVEPWKRHVTWHSQEVGWPKYYESYDWNDFKKEGLVFHRDHQYFECIWLVYAEALKEAITIHNIRALDGTYMTTGDVIRSNEKLFWTVATFPTHFKIFGRFRGFPALPSQRQTEELLIYYGLQLQIKIILLIYCGLDAFYKL
jgi:hypothetical protein